MRLTEEELARLKRRRAGRAGRRRRTCALIGASTRGRSRRPTTWR
ncbi:MAG: hypothetical protein ACLSVD_01855 [Eggerthellaceae bacterium]